MYAGKKLRQIRQHLELNQEDFSKELHISQPYYSAVESGKKEITNKMIDVISLKWGISKDFFEGKIDYDDIIIKGVKKGGISGGKDSIEYKERLITKKIEELGVLFGGTDDLGVTARNTLEAKDKLRDKLRLDLEQNHRELFDLLKLIESVSVRIDILEDAFGCYLNSLPNLAYTPLIADIQPNKLKRHSVYNVDYKKYKDDVINYLSNLEKYKEAINHYQNETDKFLKILKPLDVFGIII